MVRLRLKRYGRTNLVHFRLNAVDERRPRDGAVIEPLGFYDPLEADPAKQCKINPDRVKYWLSVGAQPTDTVLTLLVRAGIVTRPPYKPRRGKPNPPRKKVVKEGEAGAAPTAGTPAPTAVAAAPATAAPAATPTPAAAAEGEKKA